MEQIKTVMGEVVQTASPTITSEQEAANNASFGRYTYDPMSRMQQSMVSLPGWQGYSTNPNPSGFYQQPMPMGYIGQSMMMNQPGYSGYGIGMNPYMYNPGMYGYPMYQQPIQQQQPQVMQIPPLNYRGDFLPPKDYEERLTKLANEYWIKEQEQAVKNHSNYNSAFGYNYYGGWFNNFYSPLRMEANNIVQSMQQEARENRINFNINLGKLAFNLTYGKGNYDESQLEDIYRGKVIDNPMGVSMQQLYEQNRFANLVPFDNSAYYQAFHNQVSAQHNAIIKPDSNLKEAFENAGELWAMYEMEDEMHRRRNLTGAYDSDGYKYFVRKCIAERNNVQDSRFMGNNVASGSLMGNSIPAPGSMNVYTSNPRNGGSHVTTIPSIDNEGNMNLTLSIPCNFGSQKGSVYTISNQNEAAYDKKREEFSRFIDSIPKSIYQLNGGG